MATTYNFPPTSRYAGIELATFEQPDGTPCVYLRRRWLPPAGRFAPLRLHLVTAGERVDRLAAQELGDAEAFWRIADANDVLRPEELIDTVGRAVRITLPEGIPGAAALG
jgi:hypothetical protein